MRARKFKEILQDSVNQGPTLGIERVLEQDRETPIVEAPAADKGLFATFGAFLQAVAQAAMPGGRPDGRLFQAGPSGMSSGLTTRPRMPSRRNWPRMPRVR